MLGHIFQLYKPNVLELKLVIKIVNFYKYLYVNVFIIYVPNNNARFIIKYLIKFMRYFT